MPYNEDLDARIAEVVSGWNAERREMFGGTCYLLNGHMMCGVHKEYLILHLGEPDASEALATTLARPFDITGKPMKGWIMVDKRGYQGEHLTRWLEKVRAFAESLPPK